MLEIEALDPRTDPSLFFYIKHATIKDVLNAVKSSIGFGVFLLILYSIFVGGPHLAAGYLGLTGFSWSSLPRSVWLAIGWVAISWYCRGKRVQLTIPKLYFSEWVILTIVVLLGIFLVDESWWSAVLYFACNGTFAFFMDRLYEAGKQNYALCMGGT